MREKYSDLERERKKEGNEGKKLCKTLRVMKVERTDDERLPLKSQTTRQKVYVVKFLPILIERDCV